MRERKPSIKDIAKATGLSTAAVSYALNGKGRVSPETVEIVQKVAGQLGFVRDDTAARLRTGKSNLLGAVVHDISNPFFAELLSDFESAAYAEGFLTIAANTKDDPERQSALIDGLVAQGVAGLMISPVQTSSAKHLEGPLRYGLPIVISVRDIGMDNVDFIGTNDRRAGYLAAVHLIKSGFKEFAFIGGYSHTPTFSMRLQGVRDALMTTGGSISDDWIVDGPPTRQGGETAMELLLARHPECRAAICFNDISALGAYAAVHGAGMTIGRDFSIIGFDNVPQASALLPALSTVELFPRRVGKDAALALISRVNGGNAPPCRQLVEPELVIRNSVAGAIA